MRDASIYVENLSKCYQLDALSGHDRLSDMICGLPRALARTSSRWLAGTRDRADGAKPSLFWALKDVSFDVRRGEVVGVVGRNGAGKSTLLKILSRVTEPSAGRFGVLGRVGSLLEVGTGFHPELTGRENIYLNGTILGMSRREIRRRFDDIIAFAAIAGAFLDVPVKRYSSGMYVRLGFAIAAHVETEVLIVDEVLAVGDQEFQKRCLGRMQDVALQGRTVLYVSHNLSSVRRLCSRALLVEEGRLALCGTPDEVIRQYMPRCPEDCREVCYPTNPSLPMQLLRAALTSPTESPVPLSASLRFEITLQTRQPIPGAYVSLGIRNSLDDVVYWTADIDSPRFAAGRPGIVTLSCQCPTHLLTPGQYSANFAIISPHKGIIHHDRARRVLLRVHDQESYLAAHGIQVPGVTAVPSRWIMLEESKPELPPCETEPGKAAA